MYKTILIKTKESTLPDIVKRTDATIIDGSLKNLFFSYLGYELVDEMHDDNNIPYYRLLRPAQILLEFEQVKPDAFNELFYEWLEILEYLFINGIEQSSSIKVFKFRLSQELANWLLVCNDSLYNNIGVKLSKTTNISINIDHEQFDEIVNYFMQAIKQKIDNTENLLNIVFCNNKINESSFIAKILAERLSLNTGMLSHIQIMPFAYWKDQQFESFKDCCQIKKVVYYTRDDNNGCSVGNDNRIHFENDDKGAYLKIRFYITVLKPCNMRYDLQLRICDILPHTIWSTTINQTISVNSPKDSIIERDFVIDFPYCNCDYKCVLFANDESINEISIRCDYYLEWLNDDHGYNNNNDPGSFLRNSALSGG